MVDAGILCNGKIGTERQFLEDAADAEPLGADDRIVLRDRFADRHAAAVEHQRSRQYVHQRRLAGAVMADEPDAFAGANVEIDAIKRPHGAEMFLGAAEADDDPGGHSLHRRDHHLILALMASMASACVYSLVATLPTGISVRCFSKSSCVNAR